MRQGVHIADMTNLIKEHRTASGLTLVQFAEVVGVSHTTVLRWESGAVKIDPARALEINRKHGVPLGTLRPDLWKDHTPAGNRP